MEESTPPQRPSHVRVVAWAIVLMLCSFVLGVFVGLHPSWIPISIPLPASGTNTTPETVGPLSGVPSAATPATQATMQATTQP